MLVYWLYQAATWLAPRLPRPMRRWLASAAGSSAFWLARPARRAVLQNLCQVLGPQYPELMSVARKVFQNAAQNYVDLFDLRQADPAWIHDHVTIFGWEYVAAALTRDTGIVVVTAHTGSFHLALQTSQLIPRPITVLVEALRPPQLFRLITGLRGNTGISFVPVGIQSMKTLLGALRRREVVVMASDRAIQGRGLRLPFLGRPTAVPTGAAELALRTNSVLLPIFAIRQSAEAFSIMIEPPIESPVTGDHEADVRAATQQVVAILERYIRRYPDQWVVFQPIWPSNDASVSQFAVAEGRILPSERA